MVKHLKKNKENSPSNMINKTLPLVKMIFTSLIFELCLFPGTSYFRKIMPWEIGLTNMDQKIWLRYMGNEVVLSVRVKKYRRVTKYGSDIWVRYMGYKICSRYIGHGVWSSYMVHKIWLIYMVTKK